MDRDDFYVRARTHRCRRRGRRILDTRVPSRACKKIQWHHVVSKKARPLPCGPRSAASYAHRLSSRRVRPARTRVIGINTLYVSHDVCVSLLSLDRASACCYKYVDTRAFQNGRTHVARVTRSARFDRGTNVSTCVDIEWGVYTRRSGPRTGLPTHHHAVARYDVRVWPITSTRVQASTAYTRKLNVFEKTWGIVSNPFGKKKKKTKK